MAFQPMPIGCVGVVIDMLLNAIPVVVTMNFRTIGHGAATAADGSTLTDAIGTWLNTVAAPLFSSDLIFVRTRAVDATSASGWMAVTDAGFTGSISSRAVANQAAAVVTLNTDQRGRSYRGRNYWPGVPETEKDNPLQWTAVFVEALQDAYEELFSAIGTAGFTMEVFSRIQNHVELATGVSTPVSSFVAKLPIYTQRGRTN